MTLTKAQLLGSESFPRAPPREAPWKAGQGAGLARVFAAQQTSVQTQGFLSQSLMGEAQKSLSTPGGYPELPLPQ